MAKINENKERLISIVKGSPARKEHLRVTQKRSKAERERDRILRIPKKPLKIPDPFKT